MTTQARLIAQKQAEALEEFARTNLNGWELESERGACLDEARSLRAQAEAEQPEGEKGEQEMFEAWAPVQNLHLASRAGMYTDPYTRDAWTAWLARSHQAQAVDGETPRTDAAEDQWRRAEDEVRDDDGGPLSQLNRTRHPDIFGLARQLERELNSALATPPTQQEALAPVGERQIFDDWPQYHDEAMGCGLEDRNILDRYEAMRYGWDQALERVAERLPPINATPSPQAMPEGFVLVPREASDEMMRKGVDAGSAANPPNWEGAGRPGYTQVRAIYEAMLSAAPPAPAKDGWISVEERLPEIDTYYLAYIKPILGDAFLSINYFAKQKNPAISGWTTNKVTHWHELPLPPKS